MELYHGSNITVEEPKILVSGHYKDFGFGFYCTEIKRQAIRWALTKNPGHVVNIYEYTPNKALAYKSFPEMSEEWLDFIADCRAGKSHEYDIVEGPMADDVVWNYVEDFLAGKISREAFWALAKFKYPTHQIVFLTDRSLKTLAFKGAETYGK